MKSMADGEESTLLNTSKEVLNLNGKILVMLREVDLSLQFQEVNLILKSCIDS
jgi:hypothetical protein